jgi:acetylornithine deacetylase/succinyl-diaminopimelate desuccinylase-like protein
MIAARAAAFCLGLLLTAQIACAQPAAPLRPDQTRFRAIYKELVETNTALSAGDCTLAARRMAAHLRQAGYPESDLVVFTAPGHPKEGGLVAVLPGRDPKARAILLLAHLDVVEAKRADWTRDPFRLIEEGGYFYGRGTADDKELAAVWVDTMVRLKTARPRRTVKMALTCGEETAGAFNGAQWLAKNRKSLIDAEFALTEGGWGRIDDRGRRIALNINAGEKLPQNYTLEVTSPGGHAMRPVKDNAIVRLGAALGRINAYDFPLEITGASRAFFDGMGPRIGGPVGAAMTAFARNPRNEKAARMLAADPAYNAMMRTTCAVTMISGGHATNALPQRADANVNCRIFPGTTIEQVQARLTRLAADPQVHVTARTRAKEAVKQAPPLTEAIMGPIRRQAAKHFRGVPVIPALEIGSTDAAYLTPAGIPTYGFTGMFFEPDGSRLHGLNERIRTDVVYQGRDFLFDLVRDYAG